ncbi:hypothetical protein [Nonomuraea sp. NPDC005650]|uniref:RICIN domain-containing protein n=1 Tax=Nonomuraea sp. NPDC005650 TaxID=3157045 RepID=UPI00339E1606
MPVRTRRLAMLLAGAALATLAPLTSASASTADDPATDPVPVEQQEPAEPAPADPSPAETAPSEDPAPDEDPAHAEDGPEAGTLAAGYTTMRFILNGKDRCIEVPEYSKQAGRGITLWDCKSPGNRSNQEWLIKRPQPGHLLLTPLP